MKIVGLFADQIKRGSVEVIIVVVLFQHM